MKRRIGVGLILLFCCCLAAGQVKVSHALIRDDARKTDAPFSGYLPGDLQRSLMGTDIQVDGYLNDSRLQDTLPAEKGRIFMDSLGIEAGKIKLEKEPSRRSPTLAMLMSMVVPGAGQIYVKRYITIPIIWGFGYYFAKSWVTQNNRYKQYSDSVSASVLADTAHRGSDFLRGIRDLYHDDRDKFAFYLAIVYILNIVDAYVGASLYSFDVSDNLGGSAAIRFRIPLR